MSLLTLSHALECPCYILQLDRLTIMLDCGLDQSTALKFLPLDLVPGPSPPGEPWRGSARPGRVRSGKAAEAMDESGDDGAAGRGGAPASTAAASPRPGSGAAGPAVAAGADTVTVRELGGRVMLSEPLEFRIPEFGLADMETVDVVLITSCRTMLALPYLTERTGFKGVIFATEPSIQFAHHLMTSLIEHTERANRRPSESSWKSPAVAAALSGENVGTASDVDCWQQLYSAAEAAAAIGKCTSVSYGEKRATLGNCTISAHASGFCIGGANWQIQTPEHKMVYIGASSQGSNRHPLPLDVEPLCDADVCILTGVARYPLNNPDAIVNEFLSHLISTIASGGSVLVPTFSNGIVYDLIELVIARLGHAGHKLTPVYFVSPTAKPSLSYSNICASFLGSNKSDRVFLPEWPFAHAEYVATGILKHFPSITPEFMTQHYREPCVIIADQPSLRCGDAAIFFKMWNCSAKNCCVVVEPDYPFDELVAPFQPIKMRTVFCPIDPSLNFREANALLAQIAPGTVAVPAAYLKTPHHDVTGTSIAYTKGQLVSVMLGTDVDLLESSYERAYITEPLAKELTLVRVDQTTTAVGITATLNHKDYQYELGLDPKPSVGAGGVGVSSKRKVLLGALLPSRVIQALSQHGFRDVSMSRRTDADVIRLNEYDAEIVLAGNQTEIITKDNEALRLALRDSILSLLTEL